MIEKWEDEKYLVFYYMCLVGRMRKWKDEKLICLVKKKNEMIENEVGINQWQSQDFSLEGAKLKDNIKSEINLKYINQQ